MTFVHFQVGNLKKKKNMPFISWFRVLKPSIPQQSHTPRRPRDCHMAVGRKDPSPNGLDVSMVWWYGWRSSRDPKDQLGPSNGRENDPVLRRGSQNDASFFLGHDSS